MLYFTNSFHFNIIIHNNAIDTSYNIEQFIKDYIEKNILYSQKNGILLVKLKSFNYSYPKMLPNIINNIDRFKILIEGVFDCIKFVQEMIINDLVINTKNKIDNLQLFTKKLDNINITCIDKNNNTYNCKNEFATVKKINFINNNVNIIIDKYDNNKLKQLNFNTSFDINNKFIDIINNNINNSFKFNVDGKQYDFMSLIKFFTTLKKKTNYIMSIDVKKISITLDSNDFIPSLLSDQYFNNLLINLYNYYIYYKI